MPYLHTYSLCIPQEVHFVDVGKSFELNPETKTRQFLLEFKLGGIKLPNEVIGGIPASATIEGDKIIRKEYSLTVEWFLN